MMKRMTIGLAAVAVLTMGGATADAGPVDAWTLNPFGIDGVGNMYGDLPFAGSKHVYFVGYTVVQGEVQDGTLAVGDKAAVDMLLSATGFRNAGGGVVTPVSYGPGDRPVFPGEWLMNFELELGTYVLSRAGNALDTELIPYTDAQPIHPGTGVPVSGLLRVIIDGPAPGGPTVDPTVGSFAAGPGSYTDGVVVATFGVVDSPPGQILYDSLSGRIDGEFVLIDAMPGVFQTAGGVDFDDLEHGDSSVLYAIADTSTLDLDWEPTGTLVDNPAMPGWTYTGPGDETNLIAANEGRFFFDVRSTGSVIPEPVTMLAVGMSVAGLGGYVRKRRRG